MRYTMIILVFFVGAITGCESKAIKDKSEGEILLKAQELQARAENVEIKSIKSRYRNRFYHQNSYECVRLTSISGNSSGDFCFLRKEGKPILISEKIKV